MSTRRASAIQPEQFATFGQILRFLRQRAGLTQRELSIAVGYSESQMSRLEQNQRAPDEAALAARFVPALHVESEPEWAARLLELGAASRAEGSAEELAPSATVPASPNNLPVQLTSFVGRETELAEVRKQLADGARLVTLTGPGGTGKTRLALEAASGLLAASPDGVWWVELAPLADPSLIPQTVAAALGVKEEPGRPVLATLTDHLRHKRVLLILDNCEHVIQAAAKLAEDVLRGCPQVCLLASSRELLGVGGERALLVPSLRSPAPDEPLSPDRLREFEAVRLFLDRAAATAPRFALTSANAEAIVQICQRLDGIPLALELAAARLRMLPVEQLAARLDDAFRLLTGGSRTALPRHQTLQALIDWSYDLLPPAEQVLLRRLAAFAGGWTLEAAETVCAGKELEPAAVAELLGRLIDKSLVLVEERAGVARYRLMETVRQYAQAKLAVGGEADEVRGRHTAYYLALTGDGGPQLTYMVQPAWLDRMEQEHDNLRAALAWCLSAPDRAELGLRLASRLMWYWYAFGYWKEGQGWLTRALAQTGAADYPHAKAWALAALGIMLGSLGDFSAAQAQHEQALTLFRELGDRSNCAMLLERLGWNAREQGDGATARAWLQESQAFYRELGDQAGFSAANMTLAGTMIMDGELSEAKALLDENLRLARQWDNHNMLGWSLNHLGQIAQLEGEHAEALRLHEASLHPFGKLGARNAGHRWGHQGLGETYLALGEVSQATSHFREALLIARDFGDAAGVAWCLAGSAGTVALNGEPERAVWLWGAAEALRQSIGAREAPAAHATHERLQAQARAQLGEADFAAYWAAGGAAPLSEAIEHALR